MRHPAWVDHRDQDDQRAEHHQVERAAGRGQVGPRVLLQRDPAHIKRLWKEAFKVWFKGPDDPTIVLIRLIPTEAEYWDNSGLQGLKLALKSAAAYVTGKELRESGDVNTHAKVQL